MSESTTAQKKDPRAEIEDSKQATQSAYKQAAKGKTAKADDHEDDGLDSFMKEVFIPEEKREATARELRRISTGTPLNTIKEDKSNGLHHGQDEVKGDGSDKGGGGLLSKKSRSCSTCTRNPVGRPDQVNTDQENLAYIAQYDFLNSNHELD
jgi:hypothetical protein